jgi:hypothetical protein
VIIAWPEAFGGQFDPGLDFVHRQFATDDASAHDEEIIRFEAVRVRDTGGG